MGYILDLFFSGFELRVILAEEIKFQAAKLILSLQVLAQGLLCASESPIMMSMILEGLGSITVYHSVNCVCVGNQDCLSGARLCLSRRLYM